MATLEKLLESYNTELITRLENYVTEDFSEFTKELDKTWKEILKEKEEEISIISDDKEATAKRELRKKYKAFFSNMREDKKEYNTWREAFVNKFQNRGALLEALNPIIEAHKKLIDTIPERSLTNKKPRYTKFVAAYEKMLTEMAYLCFPLEPLYKRYKITATVGRKKAEGGGYDYSSTHEILDKALMNPDFTIFGREQPPSTSAFHRYRFQDPSVSKQHGQLGYNKDGYLIYKQLGKNPSTIVDAEGIERPVEQGKREILVRAHLDGDTEEAHIYFGGKDGKLYTIRLELEPKIEAGQLKDTGSASPSKLT